MYEEIPDGELLRWLWARDEDGGMVVRIER